MAYFDQELQQLQAQIARKKQLEAQKRELWSQRDELSNRVQQLETVKLDEEADVERLEGRSLAAFFYYITGRIDEKRNQERQEAYAARVKYDAAVKELDGAEQDLQTCESELSGLRDCERRYAAVLREKAAAVKAAGGVSGEHILQLEEQLAQLESQKKELQEAISAGHTALGTAYRILSSLNSAEGWGTWDLFGGGLIPDIAKHSHLDDAQSQIEQLQSQLRRFQTELADVNIHRGMQVSVEGFLRFADYFFDGLFADWAVLDHIHQSQRQVETTRNQIEGVLSRLEAMMQAVEQEQAQLTEQLNTLVRETPLEANRIGGGTYEICGRL